MKKILITLSMIFGLIATSKAEVVSCGFTAGTNLSKYEIDGLSIDNKLGAYAQVGADIKILFLNFAPEVIYRFNRFDVTSPGSYKVSNHAIEGNIMAGVRLFNLLILEAGPRYIYDIKTVAKYGDGTEKKLDQLHPEWGYSAGLRFTFSNFIIGARYNGHFDKHNSSLGRMKTQSLTISVGCKM